MPRHNTERFQSDDDTKGGFCSSTVLLSAADGSRKRGKNRKRRSLQRTITAATGNKDFKQLDSATADSVLAQPKSLLERTKECWTPSTANLPTGSFVTRHISHSEADT